MFEHCSHRAALLFPLCITTSLGHIRQNGQQTQKSHCLSNRLTMLFILMLKRNGGCSAITEEREVSWSRQHPSRTGPCMWRECNHRSHDNLQQDLADRRMANPKDPVLSHQTYQEDNLRQCQNYRTISLISHPSKVMLKIILNSLKPLMEKIIAEEQAGFRAGRSTTEHIFNLRILCEKYHQHQQDLYPVFIDFKKAFDRVWHAALWAQVIKSPITRPLVPSSLTAA